MRPEHWIVAGGLFSTALVVFHLSFWKLFRWKTELLAPGLGRTLLFSIALFWYLRAVQQALFFGMRKPLSVAFFLLFTLGGSLYAAALP